MEQIPELFKLIFFFFLGTVIGSFLNVVIYRMPRNKSIIYPSSSCPNCGYKIKWYENIPIISYILLKGKCKNCSSKISLRYPLVELLTGVLFVAAYLKWGLSIDLFFNLIFISLVIAITFIDFDFKIIPDELNLLGFISGFVYSFFRENFTPLDALLGALTGAGFLFVVAFLYLKLRKIEGLGMGDVKLLAFFGTYLGWFGGLFTIFLGSLIGAVFGIIMAYRKNQDNKGQFEIPFGPFLSLAATVYLFFGDFIKKFYLGI